MPLPRNASYVRRFVQAGHFHCNKGRQGCQAAYRLSSAGFDRRECFVKTLEEVRQRHGFALIGYVVMPEHVHLLTGESGQKNPSKILQVLKQKVARALLSRQRRKDDRQLELPFRDGAPNLTHFWQRRFYDFNVWSEKKLREKLDYMHRNPVTRKLVSHPKDWPWSSWANYARKEKARIGIDFV